jgi:2-desacetyl-2-hydroxyethyl bacteriochlorophyllide A dehydrogenase
MQAMVYTEYGLPDVLQLAEVAAPTPGDDDVLIRVHAAGVNAGDWILLRGQPFPVRLMAGLRRPKHPILGADVAGRVEAVGRNVTELQPGDEVFGDLSDSGYGAFAEYVAVPAHAVTRKPAAMSFARAAAVPSAALTALHGLRDEAQVQPGQRVLVNGASGGVGTFAVQIAKALGAVVTGVTSTRNLELVRSLGADHVVDYTQEDFTRAGQRYDVILDAAAFRPFAEHQRALAPGGTYVLVGGSFQQNLAVMALGPWRSWRSGQQFRTFVKQAKPHNLAFVRELLEAGRLAPAIDRCYRLDEAAEALRYLGTHRARGKVVITVGQG